ncbi:MAG: hypothetical protein L6R19_22655 [Alphaproteobacteria bacterium]|nr:hypothetical protein [Alphaproteobacteria bacterium]
MQVQSSLGPAGIGTATSASGGPPVESAPAPSPAPSVSPEPSAPPPQGGAPPPVVAAPPPLPSERPAVAPRARLAYDSESARVYVEVLDRSTGDVLFTVPAVRARDAFPDGLPQGSLVDQTV